MLVQAELVRLAAQLLLRRARAGDDEAHVPEPLDQSGQGLERELEALLVDQAAHQQHQLLLGLREARAQGVEVVDRHQLGRVDAVRDHGDSRLLEPEDVGRVLAHVGRACDQALGPVGHPSLHAVDVGLRVLVHVALVAPVLGGVDRHHEGRPEAVGQVVTGRGHEPVVPVHDVEVVAVTHLHPHGQHVGVHPLDPGHELAQLTRALGLPHAMDHHAVHLLLGRRFLAATGEHVHLHVLSGEVLGQLPDMTCQTALDERRVFPGKDQGSHAYGVVSEARSRSGARWRKAGAGTGAESVRAAIAASWSALWACTRRCG